MITNSNDTVLRSFIGVIAAAAMTATVFYGAVGPDPNEHVWTQNLTQVESSVNGDYLA